MQSREELALSILDDIMNPKPVEPKELLQLNSDYGFSDIPVNVLDAKDIELLQQLEAVLEQDGIDELASNAYDTLRDWRHAFSRYQESEEWFLRVDAFHDEMKQKASLILKPATVKVVSPYEDTRSLSPVSGSTGVIVGQKYHKDYQHVSKGVIYLRVRFDLPLRLNKSNKSVKGEYDVYVNDDILSDDNGGVDQYRLENPEVSTIWWTRDNDDYVCFYYLPEEIEYI